MQSTRLTDCEAKQCGSVVSSKDANSFMNVLQSIGENERFEVNELKGKRNHCYI